jgi:hypothetical protein
MTTFRYSCLLVVLGTFFLSTVNAFVVRNSVQFPAKASFLRAEENDYDEDNEPTPSFAHSHEDDESLDPFIFTSTRDDKISQSSFKILESDTFTVLVELFVIGFASFAVYINILVILAYSHDAIFPGCHCQ